MPCVEQWCMSCHFWFSCWFTVSQKLYLPLLRVGWSFPFLLHFQHISQLLKDLVMSPCIFPLIYSFLSSWQNMQRMIALFPHTLQFGSSLFPHCCKFAKDRTVSYTNLCKNDILHLSRLFYKVLSGLTPALASPTSFRHRISSSILFVFLLSSHVLLLQPEA